MNFVTKFNIEPKNRQKLLKQKICDKNIPSLTNVTLLCLKGPFLVSYLWTPNNP